MSNPTKTIAPFLPMPNDLLGPDLVVASCWLVDSYGHDADSYGQDGYYRADLLLLRNNTDDAGYYSVVHIACREDEDDWQREAEDIYPNIIPAAEAYSAQIGGY